MHRIHVTGNAGAGKTTLARELGRRLGLPVIHMDEGLWLPGWRSISRDERRAYESRITSGESWIIDGVSRVVRSHADTVIFVDTPPLVCLARGIRRCVQVGMRTRPEMPKGCPEIQALPKVLRIVPHFHRHARPEILEEFKRTEAGRRNLHLRSGEDLENLWASLEIR